MKTRRFLLIGALVGISVSMLAQSLDASMFNNIKPRNIGPAGMSGRVTAIDVVKDNLDEIFIGAAAGGVWKSSNGGDTWAPIFENEKTSSIGDISIYQNNPDIIYVGTGEGNPRNSQNSGVGMYKTMDGGRSWQHLGLEDTRQIHRVIVHPQNPDVVWAGSQGSAWAPNPGRGVYKSKDGGKTWDHVLYINDSTGVADLRIDPSNPNRLICAMWQYQREPWFFNSGGAGSGIFLSNDGGESWERLDCDSGLPCGELGRIGLAYAHGNSDFVYAYVESKQNAIYRSEDGGHTWQKRSNSGDKIGDRPFYYADLYVDVKNENRVYSIATEVTVSEDGGATWEVFAAGNRVHTDHHAWWAHPENPDHLINGNDGGLFFTRDRGENWLFVDNLPLAQFYHMRVDNEIPYNVYGGLQDNGSWCGPSQTWFKGGIRNMYWQRLSVGDGFDVIPDPLDNNYGYAMGQAGSLVRYNKASGQLQPIRPVHPNDEYLRWNWNAGIAIDPIDNLTIYYGSQFLHKSSDHGRTWQIISPDLTTDNPEKQHFLETGGLTYDVTGAEFHGSIVSIAPSSLDQNVIWVGTDDGNVQVTTDGGKSWSLVNNMSGVPDATWVPHIHVSKYKVGEAWVVFGDHRRNNWDAYVYHTSDYGSTWTRVVDNDDVEGYVNVFVQDPEEPSLWFCGTDVGLYYSVDAGATWNKWTNGFPTTPVHDLAIQERDGDLVIATFGRAFWILDDLRPLREIAADSEVMSKSLHAFSAPDAILASIGESHGYRQGKIGDVLYNGENRGYGSLVTVYLDDIAEDGDTLFIQVEDAQGNTVRHLEKQIEQGGLHRFNWDLSRDRPRFPNQKKPGKPSFGRGAKVPPGAYFIKVSCNGSSASTSVVVLPDPRMTRTINDFSGKNDMINEVYALISDATSAADEMRDLEERLSWIRSSAESSNVALDDSLMNGFTKALEAQRHKLIGKKVQGIYRQPDVVGTILGQTSYMLDILDPVTSNQRNQLKVAQRSVTKFLEGWESFKRTWKPLLRSEIEAKGLSLLN